MRDVKAFQEYFKYFLKLIVGEKNEGWVVIASSVRRISYFKHRNLETTLKVAIGLAFLYLLMNLIINIY